MKLNTFFQRPQTIGRIEKFRYLLAWRLFQVEEHTNNRIKNLVDPNSLNAKTRALLVNALYFKVHNTIHQNMVSPFLSNNVNNSKYFLGKLEFKVQTENNIGPGLPR